MRRLLIAFLALAFLATTAPLASGSDATSGGPTPFVGKGKKCKKGYVRKKNGKCVKRKTPTKVTPHPGLDIFANPGTYPGTNGVTATTSIDAAGGHFISLKIVFPSGNVSCQGLPPYPSVTISIADMGVSDFGNFAGTSSANGAYASIQGHYTGPNSLVLDSAGASNVKVKGERCAAQYSSATVVF
ncbi:MAG TPA: hypothetical protein VHR18_04165 [Solirubrobacterales bacterium]|nr:hypothetical protein [Solirubrobacterales bacterium]